MQIDFFEEFPGPESFAPARLLREKCVVYIAARSLADFQKSAEQLKSIQPLAEPGYWPILEKSYWVSPFSYSSELDRLIQDLEALPQTHVLIDLELPLLAPRLFFRNFHGLFTNRRRIQRIVSSRHRILTAVYPATGPISESILRFLGIWHPGVESCVMYYTSMIKSQRLLQWMQTAIRRRAKHGHRTAGLGCLAAGIFGTEPILSPEGLSVDMAFLRESGVERAVLFRLGGWNSRYADAVRK